MAQKTDEKPLSQGQHRRRDFLKSAALGLGTLAVGATAASCDPGSDDERKPLPDLTAAVPSAAAWKFAVMSDTQWTKEDDGRNPNSCAVEIIQRLNAQLVKHGVEFVVHVGDLADDASSDRTYTARKSVGGVASTYDHTNREAEDVRALFAQALYAAGIGLFPLRGNHDAAPGSAAEFKSIYPQTRGGDHNATPAGVFALTNNDAETLAFPTRSGPAFAIGSDYSSPAGMEGLSYAFTVGNARFVLLDQFPNESGTSAGGAAHDLATAIPSQQEWIAEALAATPAGGHAFVFAHKGLLTEDHEDVLFGTPAPDAEGTGNTALNAGLDAFIATLAASGARYFFCGHDHMHDHSRVSTMDGTASVMQVVAASNSSKFYTPAITPHDATFYGGKRQRVVSQELYSIGYYVVTVDGDNVSVEFHSAPSHAVDTISTTPTLHFTLRERFGYGRGGKELLIASGAEYTAVADTGPGGTAMSIPSGTNWNMQTDGSGRLLTAKVSTGWLPRDEITSSDILLLQGLAQLAMGSGRTDPYVLQLDYAGDFAPADLAAGALVLAAPSAGKWVNAAALTAAGKGTFVVGPWSAGHVVGTYGIDTEAGTVWAVLDFQGYFAAVAGA